MKALRFIAVITVLVAIAVLLGYMARRRTECPLYAAVRQQRRERLERRAKRAIFLQKILEQILSALNWMTTIDTTPAGRPGPRQRPAR